MTVSENSFELLLGRRVWCWTALLVCLACGCHRGGMQATSLPLEYHAPLVRSAQNLDLSQLTRAAPGSEVVQPGDVLAMTIATGLEREEIPPQLLRVAANGAVNVPLVGPVVLAGYELPLAEAAVREAGIRAAVYRNPQVSIRLDSRSGNQVTVLGAVVKPGSYKIPRGGSDLLSALVAAGGLREDAHTVVEIRHPPGLVATAANGFNAPVPPTVRVDLANARAASDEQVRVYDGSVVMVPVQPPPTVFVMGLVKEANQYEFPRDTELRLLDAIAMAGGRTLEVADKVRIVRQVPGAAEPVVIAVRFSEAQRSGAANLRLAPGDVVHVEETPLTFTIETLRSFIRFGFSSAIPGL